jgi:hypothetical protein
MTDNTSKTEAPKDVWRNVGDNDRVFDTSDGFHVHVIRHGNEWKSRVTDTRTKRFRESKLTYVSDSAAEAASMKVINNMRENRRAHDGSQRSLKT